MVTALYEWLQNLAFYLVLVTAILHMIPETGYKKYIQFFTSLVLIIMLVSPILQILGTEITLADFYQESEFEIEVEQKLEEWQKEQVKEKENDSEIKVEEIQIE